MERIEALLELREHWDTNSPYDATDLTDFGVLAIFALAARRLDAQGRRDLAQDLMGILFRAGELDDDFLLDATHRVALGLGQAAVQPAMNLIETKGPEAACWFHAARLLESAAVDADEETKASISRLCRRVIQEDPDPTNRYPGCIPAIRVLAALNDTDSLPLLRALHKASGSPDAREAIQSLEGRRVDLWDDKDADEAKPVEKWLPEQIAEMRRLLDAQREPGTSVVEGDREERSPGRYDELMREFVDSEAHKALPDAVKEEAGFAVSLFLQYAWDGLGIALEALSAADVNEILLDWFPWRILAERSFYESAPGALAAFLDWLGDTGRLGDPAPLRQAVLDCADEMLERSQDSRNWGPGKSLMTAAEKAGIDTTDPSAVRRFAQGKQSPLWGDPSDGLYPEGPQPERDLFAGSPIVRDETRLKRNDPCPCGSGKKYKKCCGRPS
jgi:hypothetical protein